MAKASQIIVLGEDALHHRFVRQVLYRLGFDGHDIRSEPVPSSRGCGEQWVRERYANAVKEYRRRVASTALVVAIDADTGDRDRRVAQLRDALAAHELAARAPDEAIVHLIPRRNIETWILCLCGQVVDEDQDYSDTHDINMKVKAAANAFFNWSRPSVHLPDHCVPSLRAAIEEVRRLEHVRD